jgi:hypothetical protein
VAGAKTFDMKPIKCLLHAAMCLVLHVQADVQLPQLSARDAVDAGRVARVYGDAGWSTSGVARDGRSAARDHRLDFLGAIGNRPVVNMQTDGRLLTGANVSAQGMPPYIIRATDHVNGISIPVVRIELNPAARITARSWRTQVADAPIEPYRRYAWVLTFKLDSSWDTALIRQRGLLWQLFGRHRPGQHGNPVIAFNLDRNELYCSVLYPKADNLDAPSEYVQWEAGQYLPQRLPRRTLEPGRYHSLQIEMFADDRTGQQGGRGYMRVMLDGEAWIDYSGPTLQPDLAGPHTPLWGWYQWEGRPSQPRVIWWAVNQMYVDERTGRAR